MKPTITNDAIKAARQQLQDIASAEADLVEKKRKAAESFKNVTLKLLQDAAEMVEAIPQDSRAAMYATEDFKSVLDCLGLQAKGARSTGSGQKRGPKVSDEKALAYLKQSRSEAEMAKEWGLKLSTVIQKMSRLKGKGKVESKMVDGVKKWVTI